MLMPISRRELIFGITGRIFGLHEDPHRVESQQSVLVGSGQFTPYGTNDELMNWQVLYRCGLNLDVVNSSMMQLVLHQADSVEDLKTVPGMIVSNELADKIIPRLPGGLEFVKSVFTENRPYLIAPDTADLDRALGSTRDPWDYIGREVLLQRNQRVLQEGTYQETVHSEPAYIFDVMAAEDRSLPGNRNFFCDADPNTYERFLGIRVYDSAPYFRTMRGQIVNELPYVSLRFDPNNLERGR